MIDEKNIIEEIISIGYKMTQIKNIDILLETILTEARKLVHADAGTFYLTEGENLRFIYTQNDTFQKRLEPGKKISFESYTIPIKDMSISGYVALTGEILNIDDVNQLDPFTPYHFNPEIDHNTGYHTVSMLTIPLKTPNDKVIGILQLINAKDKHSKIIPFNYDDIPYIIHFANNAAVALERAEMTRVIILRMIKMAELRDPMETGPHVNRVAAYSAELYENWAVKHKVAEKKWKHQKDLIRLAAMLHDVGKVGIPDSILKKNCGLSEDEYDIIKQHPLVGARLFTDNQSELDDMSREIALHHHERWDGNGYPGNLDLKTGTYIQNKKTALKGKEIPLMARIVSITDVFDALSCRRSYKEPWPLDKVWNEIQEKAGSQFDPELVELFLKMKDEIISIMKKYPEISE